MKITFLTPVQHGADTFGEGVVADLADKEAKRLVAQGLAVAGEKKPDADEPQGGQATLTAD